MSGKWKGQGLIIKVIDLNCDLGESFGVYKAGADADVLKFISSANIACGFHAGDPVVMQQTVRLALERGVAIGAHPGYPDLMGFGRREMRLSPEEVEAYVIYQIGALMGVVRSLGGTLQHVKPHGMLYNMAVKDQLLAQAIARAVARVDDKLILVALAGSELAQAGRNIGLRVANEVFADRGYNPDGSLAARGTKGALISNPQAAAQRVAQIVKEGKVAAIDGTTIPLEADTICLHGDNPEAVMYAMTIKKALKGEGMKIEPLNSFVK